MYTNLLNKVMNSSWQWVATTKAKLRKIYPNLANSDLDEEVFVKLFSEFLAGKRTSDMFSEVKQNVD
jgi:phosphoglycerol transferase MdoB-like AlkP superfamily enzyme